MSNEDTASVKCVLEATEDGSVDASTVEGSRSYTSWSGLHLKHLSLSGVSNSAEKAVTLHLWASQPCYVNAKIPFPGV